VNIPALRPCGETEIGNLIERHEQPSGISRVAHRSHSHPSLWELGCLGADFGGGLFKRASHDSKECGAFCFCQGCPNQNWSLLTIQE